MREALSSERRVVVEAQATENGDSDDDVADSSGKSPIQGMAAFLARYGALPKTWSDRMSLLSGEHV